MSTWTIEEDLGCLPLEERAVVAAMVAYSGAYFCGAPDHELRPLRQTWRTEFEHRWPDRQVPDERRPCLPDGVVYLR